MIDIEKNQAGKFLMVNIVVTGKRYGIGLANPGLD